MTEIMKEGERLYAGVGPAITIDGSFECGGEVHTANCLIDMRVLLHTHWSNWSETIERSKKNIADVVQLEHGTDVIEWSDPVLVVNYEWSKPEL